MNPIQQHTDISITGIFNAVQKPHSSSSQHCKSLINSASIKEIDYTFRKINQYLKRKEEWPKRRLLRCIDYLLDHTSKIQDILTLPSLNHCMTWTLDALYEDPTSDHERQTIQIALKVSSKILEKTRSVKKHMSNLQSTFHKHSTILFDYALKQEEAVCIYAQRALLAQITWFTDHLPDIYIQRLLQKLEVIQPLLYSLSLRVPVTDHVEKRQQLESTVMYARLLEAISKHKKNNIEFEKLISIFESIAKHYELNYKNKGMLLYSITSIMHRCILEGASIQKVQTRATLLYLMDTLMRHWVRDVCCFLHPPLCEPPVLETEKNILKKLICILLALPAYDANYTFHLLLDSVNFFMCFVGQPVSPEEAVSIGSEKCIHNDMCIDVDERGYQVSFETLLKHHDLLNLILELFMQNVQQTANTLIKPMAGRIAWCIKSCFTILLQYNHDARFQSLLNRLVKMTIFFLHFDEAIGVLATSSTNISDYLWVPTIQQAKQGLILASASSMTLSEADKTVIYKSKRAFIALEKITHHPRACERLVNSDVLDLVKSEYIPSGLIHTMVIVMYALFSQFIASLLHRTAFVRTRLRDDFCLFSIMIQLLDQAVACRDDASKRESWNRVILGCLSVARTFQYDETSMKMWLLHGRLLPLILRLLKLPSIHHTNGVASISFRWSDSQVVLLASGLLEQFSVLPLCGRQVMMEENALSDIAQLFADLVKMDDMFNLTDLDDVNMLDGLSKEDHSQNEEDVVEEEEEEKEDTNIEEEERDEHGYNAYISNETHDDDDNNEEQEENRDKKEEEEQSVSLISAEHLRKSLVKILTCNDNVQFVILHDAFTKVFQPLLGTHTAVWRHRISEDLYEKKINDLQALYDFTDDTDEAMKLHELTAVAIGYAVIGSPTPAYWNHYLSMVLNLDTFGMLCQMLMDQQDNITRRHAAAQVIEVLGLEFMNTWREQDNNVMDGLSTTWQPIQDTTITETHVFFKGDDAEDQVVANRDILRLQSPIFEAMLSTTFVESTLKVIPIHDVTFHNLTLFIKVMHQIYKQKKIALLDPDTKWMDVIQLLKIADRFDTIHVKKVCEYWIMQQVQHINNTVLEGLVALYRSCRGPMEENGITSETWPFATVLQVALRTIILNLSMVCKTRVFLDMILENNEEELSMFCYAITYYLIKMVQ